MKQKQKEVLGLYTSVKGVSRIFWKFYYHRKKLILSLNKKSNTLYTVIHYSSLWQQKL